MASLAAVALVAVVAISTSHPSKALAPEERSSHRLTKETIESESDISNTDARIVLHAGFERDHDHCLELGLQPVPLVPPALRESAVACVVEETRADTPHDLHCAPLKTPGLEVATLVRTIALRAHPADLSSPAHPLRPPGAEFGSVMHDRVARPTWAIQMLPRFGKRESVAADDPCDLLKPPPLSSHARPPELSKNILHPQPCRVQPVGQHYPPHPLDHRDRHPEQHVPDAVEQVLQHSAPPALRPPILLHDGECCPANPPQPPDLVHPYQQDLCLPGQVEGYALHQPGHLPEESAPLNLDREGGLYQGFLHLPSCPADPVNHPSHYGRAVDAHLLRGAVLEVCDYGLQLLACMLVEIATPNLEEVSMDFSCSDFSTGGFMSRFADNGTDTGFHRLLMVETVFTMYRRMRGVIRSVHVVMAVEKNGMKLYVDAYCDEIDQG